VSVDLYDMGVALSELAIIAASVWLAAWLARRVIRGVLLRLAPGRRWALVVLTIAAIAVLAQALIGLGFLLPFLPEIPSTSPAARILFAVPLLLATAAAAIVEAVAARRGQVLHSLRRANDDLSWQVARVNEELWERRYRLSAYLHGPIQSTLNAGHLRLAARDTADASGVDAEFIVFDLRAMDDGLDRVFTDDSTDIGIEAELVLIRRMWEKLTDIRWCMDPAIVKQVESDQACASLCADIIGEACANAALHGHAREVEIGIERIDDRSIRLQVTSDGTLEEGAEPGLGSRKLDEATLGWDLQPTGTGVVMTADLPILSR
jgi:signal transduction histidine kinase